MKCIHECSKTT